MKKVVGIFILYSMWNAWCGILYDRVQDTVIGQIAVYLQGFTRVDKVCMGWLFIHLPIQIYLSGKMSRYLHSYAIYYYMKKGSIGSLWKEQVIASFQYAFAYYGIGLLWVMVQLVVSKQTNILGEYKAVEFLGICFALVLFTLTVAFFILLLESLTGNYQVSFVLTLVVELIVVLAGYWYPALIRPQDILYGIVGNGIGLCIVTYTSFRVTKLRFGNLMLG